MSDALTLDQIDVFLLVVEAGGFGAAARKSGRSPGAVTYLIQRMEDQLGVLLFDRSTYRPTLTEAGLALLPRARRVAEEMQGLALTAKNLSQGLEAELTLAVDSLVSAQPLASVLRQFQERYPTVQLRLFVGPFGVAVEMVRDGTADIGVAFLMHEEEDLLVEPFIMLERMMVAAPDHPLVRQESPVPQDQLRAHVQLVLTDRVGSRASRDYTVFSARTWRVDDIETKAFLLEQGLGFGTLPKHRAEVAIGAGRLTKLEIEGDDEIERPSQVSLFRKTDRAMGPSAKWMMESLRDLEASVVAHP